MKPARFVIFAPPSLTEGTWQVAWLAQGQVEVRVVIVAEAAVSAATAVSELVRANHLAGLPAMLALPAACCYSALISTQDLPRRSRAQSMLYRLEEKLPVAAEAVTADFIEEGESAFAVAVLTERLRGVVNALEDIGITIDTITPSSLLALTGLGEKSLTAIDIVVLGTSDDLELIQLRSGMPASWQVATEPAGLQRFLDLKSLMLPTAPRVLVIGTSPAIGLPGSPTLSVQPSPITSVTEAAVKGAALARSGSAVVHNLRTGDLAEDDALRGVRVPLLAALAAAILLLMSLSAAFWIRAAGYARQADAAHSEQELLFQKVFPTQQPGPSIRGRLASEELKLRAVVGAAEMPEHRAHSALLLLHETLVRLPTDLRFRITELRIAAGHVAIEGESRSHGDADRVAAALRERGGFAVEPPRTEQLRDQGVAFTLSATAGPNLQWVGKPPRNTVAKGESP